MNNRRVVVTGMGVICSIGNNISEFKEGLQSGKNGIRKIDYIDTEGCSNDKGGEIKDIERLEVEKHSKTMSFILKALEEAIEDSGLNIEDKNIGVILGSILGKFEFFEKSVCSARKNNGIKNKEDAVNWQKGCLSNIAAEICEIYGFNGPKFIVSTACAAGTNSIAYGYDLIKKGYCDFVIVGGADSLQRVSMTGFSSLMALSPSVTKPFDVNRDGLALGEGAGILILETMESALKRNAKIYTEISGYALCNDAYHVTAPDPEGKGAYYGMVKCLENSGLKPGDIDYINAHGTGTKANDLSEFKAINRLFGNNPNNIYISSNKSLFGHCLGSAGSIEAVSTILSIFYDFIPPTINIENPINLESNSPVKLVLKEMVATRVNYAMSNSFAFAGNIATIVFKKV